VADDLDDPNSDERDDQAATDRARQRAAENPAGVGVAYKGRARRDPRFPPEPGWRGVATIAGTGGELHHTLISAEPVSRHADVDEHAFATALERILGDRPFERLPELLAEGGDGGIRLHVHAPDEMSAIFP
jgi:hypothetical protein